MQSRHFDVSLLAHPAGLMSSAPGSIDSASIRYYASVINSSWRFDALTRLWSRYEMLSATSGEPNGRRNSVGYSGDRDMYCNKCKKKMKFVRCPRCNGKGGGAMSQCRHCSNSGYKCSSAPSDQYHG